MMAPVLQTDRLRLRAHAKSDFENCCAMWGDVEVVRYLGGKPSTREECWNRMLRQAGFWALAGMGSWVVETHAGEFLGEVGFLWVKRAMEPSIEGFPEVGWALAKRAHGKGYASEAVRAALAWGDANLAFQRFTCIIDPDNAASLNVARKAGFTEYARGIYHDEPIVLLERVR
ncbi:MAG: GNAT family N-acetyltransferase [Proteobacteria bacterium]|nr:GNAT family N-acetyltransferase [Pseudomonadota bacterium]